MSDSIRFNEPVYLGEEIQCIQDALERKHISGDGYYSKHCHELLQSSIGCPKALLTHSCTAALELSAMLLDISEGDEVICPSYTFVTTASAFALRGAKIVFVDIRDDTLNIDETKIEAAITEKTKALVVVHYAGVACDMDAILILAKKYDLKVVEDNAQAIGSSYKGKACGSMGSLACLSFHETKNIVSGEGGAIAINDTSYIERAEIIREKGTNRSQFFRGQVDKYTWVDLGSSYLPSDINAAYLYPQLKNLESITNTRLALWERYHAAFEDAEVCGLVRRPFVPANCEHNAHMYYLRFVDFETRTRFIDYLKQHDISTVFHYIPLHSSPAGMKYGRTSGSMTITNTVSETLSRLPLYHSMSFDTQDRVIACVKAFLETL